MFLGGGEGVFKYTKEMQILILTITISSSSFVDLLELKSDTWLNILLFYVLNKVYLVWTVKQTKLV